MCLFLRNVLIFDFLVEKQDFVDVKTLFFFFSFHQCLVEKQNFVDVRPLFFFLDATKLFKSQLQKLKIWRGGHDSFGSSGYAYACRSMNSIFFPVILLILTAAIGDPTLRR